MPIVLDVTQGLVFSNPELVAMGGAGVAFAAGGPGMLLNPAAPANRRMEAVAPLLVNLVLLQSVVTDERDLGGADALPEKLRFYNVGLACAYRDAGGGILAAGALYQVEDVSVAVSEGHASAAVSLLGGHLTLGAGPRLLDMRVTEDGHTDAYFGLGAEGGVVLANLKQAWNVGVTLRSEVTAGPIGGAYDGIDAARLPPELIAGVGWNNLANLPAGSGGVPVRLAADVVVDGPVPGAVALENLLQGDAVPRGAWYTVSPRVGAEVDVWRDRFRLRAGSYLEPSRTPLSGPRPHATGGFELRLFRFHALGGRVKLDLAWQVGVDYAPKYFRGAWLGINVWQQGQVGGQATPAPLPSGG